MDLVTTDPAAGPLFCFPDACKTHSLFFHSEFAHSDDECRRRRHNSHHHSDSHNHLPYTQRCAGPRLSWSLQLNSRLSSYIKGWRLLLLRFVPLRFDSTQSAATLGASAARWHCPLGSKSGTAEQGQRIQNLHALSVVWPCPDPQNQSHSYITFPFHSKESNL